MRRSGPIRRRSMKPSPRAMARAEDKLDEYAAASELVRRRSRGWCEANTPGCPPGRHPAGDRPHHRRLRKQGGTNDVDNLLDVCPPGHRWIHDHPTVSYAAGWLLHAAP